MSSTTSHNTSENRGKRWTEADRKSLESGYNNGSDILSLASQLKRTPGAVLTKLKSLELISDVTQATGYAEYAQSEFFRQPRERKEPKHKSNLKEVSNAQLQKEIRNLTNELRRLYKYIEYVLPQNSQ